MSDGSPLSDGPIGLELDFIHRIYRTSLVLVLLVGLLSWARFGTAAALGWTAGGVLGLAVLASVEWSVRRFVRPEESSSGRLVLASVVKMLLVAVLLALAFLAALRGWLSLFWMLGGVTLPGAVVALKLLGQRVIRAAGSERRT